MGLTSNARSDSRCRIETGNFDNTMRKVSYTFLLAGLLNCLLEPRLEAAGMVVAWGWNGHRQCDVPLAAQSGVQAIAGGVINSVALTTNGSVLVWGNPGFGITNVPSTAKSGVSAIGVGYGFVAALKTNGSVVAWGYNVYGQTNVPGTANGVTAIAVGGGFVMALRVVEL